MHWLLFFILKTPGFTSFINRLGYIGILIWFLSFDQFTPIPEEVSLLIIGYLAAHKVFNPVLAGLFCLAGFLIVDTVYFFLSEKGNSFIKKKTKGFSSIMEPYRNRLKDHSFKAILILCFIPRMRMFAPILAGSMKLSFKRFLLFDAIALTAFTTVYLSLGIIFHKSLSVIIAKAKGLQNIIFFTAVILIAGIIMFFIEKRNRKKTENQKHSAASSQA
jgi:membrane protein DedA with SNARE-associated domain